MDSNSYILTNFFLRFGRKHYIARIECGPGYSVGDCFTVSIESGHRKVVVDDSDPDMEEDGPSLEEAVALAVQRWDHEPGLRWYAVMVWKDLSEEILRYPGRHWSSWGSKHGMVTLLAQNEIAAVTAVSRMAGLPWNDTYVHPAPNPWK